MPSATGWHAARRPSRQRGLPARADRAGCSRSSSRRRRRRERRGSPGWRQAREPASVGAAAAATNPRAATSPARAKYVDDLAAHAARVAHAWPVQAPHAHARILGIDAERGRGRAGRARGADRGGHPRRERRRRRRGTTSRCSRPRSCFHGHAVAWVVAETEEQARAGGGARWRCSYEPLPAIAVDRAGDRARRAFSPSPNVIARGDASAALAQRPQRLEGESASAGRSILPRDAGRAGAGSTRRRRVRRVVDPASDRDAGRSSRTCSACRATGWSCSACAWAAASAARRRRPTPGPRWRRSPRAKTGAPGARAARPRSRHGAHRQAPSVPRALRRRLRRRRQAARARGASCSRRRLVRSTCRAPILDRALFHLDNCYYVPARRVRAAASCDEPRLEHRVPRLRRAAGHGGDRGDPRPRRAHARAAAARSCASATSTTAAARRTRPTTARRSTTTDRIARIWHELQASSDFDQRAGRDRARSTPRSPHDKRGLAITPVKFGISLHRPRFYNQAGALVLIYRDGTRAGEPRRHRDGPGAAHQDAAASRCDELGVPLDAHPRDDDRAPTRCRTPRRPRRRAARTSTARRCATPARRCASGSRRSRRAHARGARARRHACFAGRPASSDAPARASRCRSREVVEQRLPRAQVSLSATGFYRTPGHHLRPRRRARGKPFHYFAYGAAVSEVEVDGFTGMHRAAARRHPARRRRLADRRRRSRPDRGRLRAGRRAG